MENQNTGTRIFAHRGASEYAPENTLEAFQTAVNMKADGVELDVQKSRDGELVVAHDERLERVSDGTGFLADKTLKELKSLHFNRTMPGFGDCRIPTLKEVFDLLRGTGLMINIELKNSLIAYPGMEEEVIALAAKEFSLDRIIFSSFSHASMVRVKETDRSLICGLLYSASMVRPWEYAKALGMDAIHPDFSEVITPGGNCEAAHREGILVHTWTVNDEAYMDRVLEEGADILITNRPDTAAERRDRMKRMAGKR